MDFEDFVQKKCNSGKNFQFKPKKHLRIDLEKAVPLLEGLGAKIEIETSSLVILRLWETQLDLNSSGKTIAKTESKNLAKTPLH